MLRHFNFNLIYSIFYYFFSYFLNGYYRVYVLVGSGCQNKIQYTGGGSVKQQKLISS